MGLEVVAQDDGSRTEYELRACRPSDYEAIREAHGKVLPIQYAEEFFKNICWSKGSHFAVCAFPSCSRKRMAGFLSARQMQPKCLCFNDRQALQQAGAPLKPHEHVLYLLTIGVMPECRRQGVAGLMLRFAIEAARDQGCRAIVLHATCDNASASALYLKHRFIRLRRHRGFYRLPSPHAPPEEQTVLDAFVFALPLHACNTPRPLGSAAALDDATACVSPSRHPHAAQIRARSAACCTCCAANEACRCERAGEDDSGDVADSCDLWLEEAPDGVQESWTGTFAASVHRAAHGLLRAVMDSVQAMVTLRGWLQGIRCRLLAGGSGGKMAAASAGPAVRSAVPWGGVEATRARPQCSDAGIDLEAGLHEGAAVSAVLNHGGGGAGEQAGTPPHGLVCSGEGVVGVLRHLFKRTTR
eukprot:jgi/Ulvmu1/9715/UM055_0053.1